MFRELFQFDKADKLMWGGVGAFSVILIVAFTVISSAGSLLVKDLIGLVVVMILPGYTIVKLYLNDLQLSDNLTKDPDINRAIDRFIVSLGLSIASIIPLNFVWNYLLTMGGGEGKTDCTGGECKTQGGNIWGNIDEEMIYTGSASWRALFTVILVIGLAVGYKVYQIKKAKSAS